MNVTKAAVIGHPVAHSKSPLIHNYWIEKYGLSGSYEAIDVTPEDLENKIRRLADEGYKGFNATIPHKEMLLNLCDEVDDVAQQIGAVNTVTIEDGRFKGTNTDAFGFIENLKQAGGFNAGPALVLGAGGAARAVIYALTEESVEEIIIVNRTREKAEKLAESFSGVRVTDWEERSGILGGVSLLVNTTSLGMEGQEPLEIDLSEASADMIVSDIVYVPLMTDLLKQAEDRDLRTITGIGMLLHQARPAFERWFGVMPDVDEVLEQKVLA